LSTLSSLAGVLVVGVILVAVAALVVFLLLPGLTSLSARQSLLLLVLVALEVTRRKTMVSIQVLLLEQR
jgi:hypothetical protein